MVDIPAVLFAIIMQSAKAASVFWVLISPLFAARMLFSKVTIRTAGFIAHPVSRPLSVKIECLICIYNRRSKSEACGGLKV